MTANIRSMPAQLHPLHVALKRSWEKLIIVREIKQDWLAERCGVNKSTISRWKDPDAPDFPPTLQMAKFIEALQEWPGVEKWEPLEAFNIYFGCHVAELHQVNQPLNTLAGLLALDTGKVMNKFLEITAPDSDGGVEITPDELEMLAPIVHHLRRIADDLDDRLTAPESKRAVS